MAEERNKQEEALYARAKSRALFLLERMPRTEKQMREKLSTGKTPYPEAVIDRVISFLKEYRFLDDEQYARNYISYKSSSKSRRVICMELREKGISKEILEEVQDCFSDNTEEELLRRLIEKKKLNLTVATWQEQQKLCQQMMRKGFSYELISHTVQQMREEAEESADDGI